MAKKNRNILIIKKPDELVGEIDYSRFLYKDYFEFLCSIIPNKEQERLDVGESGTKRIDTKGLVYIFVIEGKIFKIGQSINSIKDRIQSYNCGKRDYRIVGTNSTTNYFVLQSLLEINRPVQVYAYFIDKKRYEIFGEVGEDTFPSTKIVERKILKDFLEKYGKKPIANTQK